MIAFTQAAPHLRHRVCVKSLPMRVGFLRTWAPAFVRDTPRSLVACSVYSPSSRRGGTAAGRRGRDDQPPT
jgi:hypothetical protein